MRRWRRWALLLGVLAAAALAWRPVAHRLAAAALLTRFSSDTPPGWSRVGSFEVEVSDATFGAGLKARTYTAKGAHHAPGLVLVHGVHHLGMDEPRLVRFAKTLASSGMNVLTPQVDGLASYRIDRSSVETIGQAVETLARVDGPRVGLMGLSFAGGLSLLTAADPRYAGQVGYIVAVGAHDDLSRVSRFFALDQAERPDGQTTALKAHAYGPLILVYDHVGDFFSPEDSDAARDALRAWLWEDHSGAQSQRPRLSEAGRARLDQLLADDLTAIRPQLLQCIARDAQTMAAVSPAGASARAPGAGAAPPRLGRHGHPRE